MGAPSQADVRRIDQAIEQEQTVTVEGQFALSGNELNFWDRFLISITPESHAEGIVNEIYSSPSRTLKPDPAYDVTDLSSPNVYVNAKGAISDTVSAIKGFAGIGIATVAIFILVALAIYVAIPALIRR